jgi:hypothetical protein
MDEMSRQAMKAMNITIVDAKIVTQSMWESSYDGLHYLYGCENDNWSGHTSSFIFQIILNAIFSVC